MSGLALIGCGRVAPCHADAFAILPDVELSWACDIEPEKAAQFAREHNFARHGSYEQALQDPAVTLVALAVPHHLHAPMAEQALRAGKHVLIEKPFSIHVEEGRNVLHLSQQAGRIAAPVAQHRFDPALVHIRGLLEQEALGQLHLVRAHLECFRNPDYYAGWRGKWSTEGGSVLINQAYHVADQMLWMAGPVEAVAAQMTTFARATMETEDALVASLRFANGALGSLSVNGASGSLWDSYIELCGSHGAVAYDIAYPNKIHRLRLQSRKLWKSSQAYFDELTANAAPPPPSLAYYGITHRQQAADFVGQTRGQTSHGATAQEALQTVDLIQRIYAACKT